MEFARQVVDRVRVDHPCPWRGPLTQKLPWSEQAAAKARDCAWRNVAREEIARQTGWTVQASRTRLRRALVRLAAILEPGC